MPICEENRLSYCLSVSRNGWSIVFVLFFLHWSFYKNNCPLKYGKFLFLVYFFPEQVLLLGFGVDPNENSYNQLRCDYFKMITHSLYMITG